MLKIIDEHKGNHGHNIVRFELTNVNSWEGLVNFTQTFVNVLKNSLEIERSEELALL